MQRRVLFACRGDSGPSPFIVVCTSQALTCPTVRDLAGPVRKDRPSRQTWAIGLLLPSLNGKDGLHALGTFTTHFPSLALLSPAWFLLLKFVNIFRKLLDSIHAHKAETNIRNSSLNL